MDEERNGTKLTINGISFTIRARLFGVDLKFGSSQADSLGQPIRLDMLQRDGTSNLAFRMKGANRGKDILVWEKDLDDVTVTASTNTQIMSMTMVPTVQYAMKLGQELAAGKMEEEVTDSRSAGIILVDVSRCAMAQKTTFHDMFTLHYKKLELVEKTPEVKPKLTVSKYFDCEYLGAGSFLKADLGLFITANTVEVQAYAAYPNDRCTLHVSCKSAEFTAFHLDKAARGLTLITSPEFAKVLSANFTQAFGGGIQVSKDAPVSCLRVRFRPTQSVDDLAEQLMRKGYKMQQVSGNILSKTFPELYQSSPVSAKGPTAKRTRASGSSQGGPAKKK